MRVVICMPATQRNCFSTRFVELIHTPVERLDRVLEPVNRDWSSLSIRLGLAGPALDSLIEPGHQLDQTSQDVFYPSQRGADLLHLHLEQRQPFFHYRHLEPPHDTVVVTVS